MSKTIISTNEAPAAIGTYSQAVKVGNTLYVSGQIPLDPKTMEVVVGDFSARVNQVFENLSSILRAAGSNFSEVVKFTIWLTDLSQFSLVNQIMAERVSAPYPARACVQVSALPKGVDIEIDAVAVLGN